MPFKTVSRALNPNDDYLLQQVISMLENVELNVYIYNESSYFEEKCSNVNEILSAVENHRSAQCVWIEVSGPIEKRQEVIQQLGVHFSLHLLTLEDIQTIDEKTKIERTGVVKSQNRPPTKIQLSTIHFIDFIKKYEFSVKLGDLRDSKM
jgi:hypothetical protein